MHGFARTLGAAASAAALAFTMLPGGPASAGHVPPEGDPQDHYFDLGALPVPNHTGEEILDGLEQFVGDFTYRLTGSPNEIRAGMALHEEMAELGYEARTVSLVNTSTVVERDDGLGAGLKVVLGIKPGTTRPEDWIMFVGHYDTVPQTIDGAYDNGAGTNLIRFLAHEFADVETNRTLVFAFYNGEEEGLLASARHANYLEAQGQEITAVLGFDMVGIAWPVANPLSSNCLCMFHGPSDGPRFDPLLRYVNYDFLEFPESIREVWIVGANTRNSDERSFANRGYPTLRWAGMRTASAYPAYHQPEDTVQTIVDVAGGEGFYEQGVENTMKSAYYTALALDNHTPVPAADLQVNGQTLSADASGSTDEDGDLSGFSWDFGDGTSAEGASVEHTYAAPGTYTVTLTVADNLWPEVTRQESYLVVVE